MAAVEREAGRGDGTPGRKRQKLREFAVPESCVTVVRKEDLRRTRSWETDTWKSKSFKLLTNHVTKGGVGKTTYSHTLAVGLAKRGKHVMYVDADSQMNATHLCLSKYASTHHRDPAIDAGSDDINWKYFFEDTHMADESLYKAMNNMLVQNNRITPPDVYKINLADLENVEEGSEEAQEFGDFYLMRGDEDLVLWDAVLSEATVHMRAEHNYSSKLVPATFINTLRCAAYVYKVDYIVVDLSPANSLFNRLAMFCSDFFFFPCTPDLKVRDAIIQLGPRLGRYLAEYNTIYQHSQYPGRAAPSLPLKPSPKFLGAIMSRFEQAGFIKPYNQFANAMAVQRAVASFMQEVRRDEDIGARFLLPEAAYADLRERVSQTILELRNIAAAQDTRCFLPDAPEPHPGLLAFIRSYGAAMPMSERASYPMPYLSPQSFTKISTDVYKAWQESLSTLTQEQRGDPSQIPPFPARDRLYHVEREANEVYRLQRKQEEVRRFLDIILDLILNENYFP